MARNGCTCSEGQAVRRQRNVPTDTLASPSRDRMLRTDRRQDWQTLGRLNTILRRQAYRLHARRSRTSRQLKVRTRTSSGSVAKEGDAIGAAPPRKCTGRAFFRLCFRLDFAEAVWPSPRGKPHSFRRRQARASGIATFYTNTPPPTTLPPDGPPGRTAAPRRPGNRPLWHEPAVPHPVAAPAWYAPLRSTPLAQTWGR